MIRGAGPKARRGEARSREPPFEKGGQGGFPRQTKSAAAPGPRWTAAVYFAYAAVFTSLVGKNVAVHLRFEDALIVLRYARNLVAGHGFVFNPGERVLGVTTPLHTLMSTIWVALAPDGAPALQNLAGLAFLVAEGFVVLAIVRRMGRPLAAIFAAILVLGNFNLSYLYFGMEVHLFAFLALLASYLYVDGREAACGAVLGLAFLTRYDAALLAGLIGTALLVERRTFPWRLTLAFAVPVVPWLLFAQLYFGSVLPSPLAAKEGHSTAAAYLVRVFFETKASFKKLIGLYAPVELLRAGLSYLYLVPVAAGITAAAFRDRRWAVLGAYPFLHVLAYAVIGPDPGFTWHYYVTSPIFFLFFTVGVAALLSIPVSAEAFPRWLPAVLTAAALVPLLLQASRDMTYRYRLDPHTEQLFEIGGWLRRSYGEETTLLQPAIGVLGWESGLRMIDHAGLVTPGLYFYDDLHATPMAEVLARFEPDLVLLSEESPADVSRFGYRPVKVFEGPLTFTLYERRR